MRVGVVLADHEISADGLFAWASELTAAGMNAAWLGQVFGWDPLAALSAIGRTSEVPELAAVIPTYPQHPLKLASQALSTQALTGNRLTLALGTSHRFIIENRYGYSFDRAGRHMPEYLSALLPALAGEDVSYDGETLSAAGAVRIRGAKAPTVLLAAHGPTMLALAGQQTDGIITMYAGPHALDNYFVPRLHAAANEASRPDPRIVVNVFAHLNSDRDAAKKQFHATMPLRELPPSYQSTLDREGVTDPADLQLIGSESQLTEQLRHLADAGATDISAALFGTPEEQRRTLAFLGSLT